MRIAYYGDSTALGSTKLPDGSYHQSCQNVPAVLQTLLRERWPTVEVCNHGVGGTTSNNWLLGQAGVPRPWDLEMCKSDADIVTINTGINDSFVAGLTVAQYIDTFDKFAKSAKAHYKKIVFVTPNPIDDPHNTGLWDFQHALTTYASANSVPVIDMYDAVAYGCPQWRTFLPDHIHPNDDLYRFMGHVAYVTMAPIVEGS